MYQILEFHTSAHLNVGDDSKQSEKNDDVQNSAECRLIIVTAEKREC